MSWQCAHVGRSWRPTAHAAECSPAAREGPGEAIAAAQEEQINSLGPGRRDLPCSSSGADVPANGHRAAIPTCNTYSYK